MKNKNELRIYRADVWINGVNDIESEDSDYTYAVAAYSHESAKSKVRKFINENLKDMITEETHIEIFAFYELTDVVSTAYL